MVKFKLFFKEGEFLQRFSPFYLLISFIFVTIVTYLNLKDMSFEDYIDFPTYRLRIISAKDKREADNKIIFDKFAKFLLKKTKKQLLHILEYGIDIGSMQEIMSDKDLIEDLNDI